MFLRYGVIVFGNLMRLFTKKIFYHQGFFAVKRRVVFILGAKWIALVRGWRSDCVVAAWKLVSNDAKRTVAPPNAKHSTLLQGCFFYVCFSPSSIYALNRILEPGVFCEPA